MLIPNKFNGYSRDGIRLYHGGRGGPNPPNPNSWEAMMANRNRAAGVGTRGGVNAGDGYVDPNAPSTTPVNAAQAAPVALTPEQRQANIARDLALSQVRGARPSGQDSQFYQPAYQPQYANYATTNPLGVSQYGTPMTIQSLVDSAYAGIGRFGVGTGTNQMDAGGRQHHIDAFQTGYYTPENFFQKFANSVQNYQTQNPNDRYTQYMQNQAGYGGGYQGYMPPMQNPFSYQPMQQPMQQAQTNYGPSQAIVGRSSQMRGTPNVMRRAEGGIASLLDNDK